ncbi:hypothetical protein D8S78_07135 [Natrialba swarupiae]|nr:hypothetical protein [Natrialba swarupiae]
MSEGWWEVRITDAAGYDDGYDEVYVEAGETELAWAKLEEGDATILPRAGCSVESSTSKPNPSRTRRYESPGTSAGRRRWDV